MLATGADLWYEDTAAETSWVVTTFFSTQATEIYPVNAVIRRYGSSSGFRWANGAAYAADSYTAWGTSQPLDTCSDMSCAVSTFGTNSAPPLTLQAYYCQSFYGASATNMVAVCKKPLCRTLRLLSLHPNSKSLLFFLQYDSFSKLRTLNWYPYALAGGRNSPIHVVCADRSAHFFSGSGDCTPNSHHPKCHFECYYASTPYCYYATKSNNWTCQTPIYQRFRAHCLEEQASNEIA